MDHYGNFECKTCHVQAEIEELTSGVLVLTCPECENNELWGQAEPSLTENFEWTATA
jgi:Zn finger protein HypA/HybF involved in hydrogenase expression